MALDYTVNLSRSSKIMFCLAPIKLSQVEMILFWGQINSFTNRTYAKRVQLADLNDAGRVLRKS
jgi:hypothetical protein